MINGNRSQCHLINVKPEWREGSTACRGSTVPGLMSPGVGVGWGGWGGVVGLNGPTFTVSLLSVSKMMVFVPSGDVAGKGCLCLGGA